MNIEFAREGHRQRWAEMRCDLWVDATLAEHLAEIDEILANGDGRLVAFMFIVEDRPVGFAEAALRVDHVNGCDTSPVGFLEGLFVAPEARRRGIARALAGAVEAWAIERGCSELASDTDSENPEGEAMHAALGFAETERVIFYRKPLG